MLAMQAKSWRQTAREAYDQSAQQNSVPHAMDYRGAALQGAADDIDAILAADTTGGES